MPSGGGGAGGGRRSAASPLARSSEARSRDPIMRIPLTDMPTAIRPTAMRRPTATATHRLTAMATHRLTVTGRPTTFGDPITATTDVINRLLAWLLGRSTNPDYPLTHLGAKTPRRVCLIFVAGFSLAEGLGIHWRFFGRRTVTPLGPTS